MIVVDTSAIVAIFAKESDAALLGRRMADDGGPFVSAAAVLECSIVIRGLRHLPTAMSEAWLDDFLASARATIEPLSLDDLQFAQQAHMQFGKGTSHPAQLNFGDCFSYALAKRLDVPLLYKGGDFARTDIKSAL
ncbi:MAG: type II toxin-antitoxin system VapC family toxin [Devosia sp.]|uniref:type II toxin-antitoxin system VapC family toxin n=1 Tax=Devosia sp. 66-22 TaxID=1895753 RepID=UPI00092732AD|nr:type II toxin-antitoxin system VapC family toxin [Devosia sp. 66-22]MBN9347803.1 type II toxin-antitoxin system VapC family toxin [Devosia sp.]OJX51284.1 MAG: VapC toxin family PIN domain ribonuclease [Devosia sp. 66-22]